MTNFAQIPPTMLHCQRYAHAGECSLYRAGAPVADKPVFLEEATKGVVRTLVRRGPALPAPMLKPARPPNQPPTRAGAAVTSPMIAPATARAMPAGRTRHRI